MKLSITIPALVVFLIILQITTAAYGRSRISVGEPVPLDQLRSLGDVIAANSSVHILYVHGMRAEGPGASKMFREKLSKSLGLQGDIAPETIPLSVGPWPKGATVAGIEIWKNEKDWEASQPYIDRYAISIPPNKTITIDEVNWWRLLFPLKCAVLVEPESRLAGVHSQHLELCASDKKPYHPWLTEKQKNEALASRPPLGGAAKANKFLKQEIVDWGLSDAVILAGPMQVYTRAAMEAAFEAAATKSPNSEFVIISESLGSFAVLDAYRPGSAVEKVMERTYNLYFFANQFALLELGRVQFPPPVDPGITGTELRDSVSQPPTSPLDALAQWAKPSSTPENQLVPDPCQIKQIIAFSDPSDALTFRVPQIGCAKVSNVYVRNAVSWLGLVAGPVKAHSGQMRNRALWKAMLKRKTAGQHPGH
jgi:hypothetical protein